ncbi:MAG: thiol-disulfide isomerase/thioredoxin [Myxococcota bacterium]|jgi:thiol-disulfide isomerase/thioredoxin
MRQCSRLGAPLLPLAPLLATLALATDLEPRAGYLLRTERPAEAALHAAQVLVEDPANLAAHRVYARSRALLDDAPTLVATYATWRDTAPTDPTAALALGWVLRATKTEDLCSQAAPLLSSVDLFERAHLAYALSRPCPALSTEDTIPTLAREAGSDIDRQAIALGAAWQDGPIVSIGPLQTVLAAEPWRARDLRQPFRDDATGPARAAVRRLLLHTAEQLVASADPAWVHAGWQVLRSAERDRAADAARDRLATLDPPDTTDLAALRAISATRRQPTYEDQLAALDQIPVPDAPRAAAAWWSRRAHALEALADLPGALIARAHAARATPNSLRTLEAYVGTALELGDDLPGAQAAVQAALASDAQRLTPVVRPLIARPTSVVPGASSDRVPLRTLTLDEWRVDSLRRRGVLLLLAGRLERALSDPEAVNTLRAALLHEAPAEVYLELGLVAPDEQAFPLLTRGLAHAPHAPAAVEARTRAEMLWPAQGLWHPTGLTGWLDDAVERTPPPPPRADDPTDHPLVGKPFPLDTVQLDGETVSLASLEGPMVVDVWATWCGPCVDAMPHLGKLAETYAPEGVRVLGLSVDTREHAVRRFFRRGRERPFPMAWTGPDVLRRLAIRSIPAQFVLDADHQVVAFVQGYRGDTDDRLQTILDALLSR